MGLPDRTEVRRNEQGDYEMLEATVAKEMGSKGTVSKETFLGIRNSKGAMRVIRHVRIEDYDTLYAPPFAVWLLSRLIVNWRYFWALVLSFRGWKPRLARQSFILSTPTVCQSSTCEPSGSYLRPVCPRLGRKNLAHYEEFRQAVERIRHNCPSWTLRQIDGALLAYHKQVLDKGSADKCQFVS